LVAITSSARLRRWRIQLPIIVSLRPPAYESAVSMKLPPSEA
jgi:hypothetical protein